VQSKGLLMAEHHSDPTVPIPESDHELISQCRIETFKSGGKGGQHQNTTDSGVRLIHIPSGIIASGRRLRSQHGNKKAALRILRKKLEASRKKSKQRISTKISRAARERRLSNKRQHSAKKSLRKKPSEDTQ